jgi:hypothetical protein
MGRGHVHHIQVEEMKLSLEMDKVRNEVAGYKW